MNDPANHSPIGYLLTVEGMPGVWDGWQIAFARPRYRGAGGTVVPTKADAERLIRRSAKNRREAGWDAFDYWRIPVYAEDRFE